MLCEDIYNEKKGSFLTVMTEMKQHATSVINNILTIEIALLRAIKDVEGWLSNTAPLSSPPSSSLAVCTKGSHGSSSNDDRDGDEFVRSGLIKDKFCVGMLVNCKRSVVSEILSHVVVVGYKNGQVLVCDQLTSTTFTYDPFTLT